MIYSSQGIDQSVPIFGITVFPYENTHTTQISTAYLEIHIAIKRHTGKVNWYTP